MYTYHYCGQRKTENGAWDTMDGIAIMKKEIKTMDDYREFKKKIWEDEENFGFLLSLTLLSK